MPLIAYLLASDLVLVFFIGVAGFWYGRRHRTLALADCAASHTADPQPARGTTARVHEPIPAAAEEAAIPPCSPHRDLRRSDVPPARLTTDGKVMIIDDEPINIKVAQKYLKLAGYQHVIGVSDSRTALNRISEEQP